MGRCCTHSTLSFSSPSSCKHKTLPTYYRSTYLCFIYLRDVRYIHKHGVFYVHSFALLRFLRLMALCGFIFAFGAFLVYFSSFLNRPTPPPFHGTESVATPFLNFFIFLVFKNFFVEKMRYDLFTFCMCLFRYWMFTFRCGFVCSLIGV